jgi:ornithine cyclodeaminase/alanine dehydrogenase-like protein (mu-crystallin family)
MEIYVTQCEHPTVPGILVKAHATRELAVAHIVATLKDIVDEHNTNRSRIPTPNSRNWESVGEALEDYYGAAYVRAELLLLHVEGA